ncbi:dipeptide epimerase [Alteromonas sp. ASW11-130]|uniref:dipeptide epimerase n=1 Tax=Alteromonas sp. ASW11-130 TaxID=3015775 RepID=UPI002242B471|nr:dipeptide epimerase [Alteromonas sp. ASW11-130]MCW8092947.1 dipeptide epimerase [Alteromonas sp. ASW11-130]
MKITGIEFANLAIPLVTPFKTALREVTHCKDLIVMITTEGNAVGIGAAPSTPLITGDTHASIKAAIDQIIAPMLIGRSLDEFNVLIQMVAKSLINNTSAKAAVDIALHDLWGQYLGQPLYKLLGGNNPRLKSDITISLNSTEVMLNDCEKALSQGFTELKLKVGNAGLEEFNRILCISQKVGDRALLRLDVNQAWTAKQTLDILAKLKQHHVVLELVEQPVHYIDLAGMAQVCAASPYPIMADESAFNARAVLDLHSRNAADIANIKLMKTGGIGPAIQMCQVAKTVNMPCMIGCMLEGPIGVTAAMHLAIAYSDCITFIDLDGAFLAQKLDKKKQSTFGITLTPPYITVNDKPGLGHIEMLDWIKQ